MKKIILFLLLLLSLFLSFKNFVWAESTASLNASLANSSQEQINSINNAAAASEASVNQASSPGTTVIVTEKIPWMTDCGNNIGTVAAPKYKCTVQPGFQSVMKMIGGFVKYATFLTALIGVLMLVAGGIMLSLSGLEPGEKAKAKEHINKIIFGLVLLFLIGFVLNTIAPWIYQ